MSEIETYIRERLTERLEAVIQANQCPDCDVLMLFTDDAQTEMFCWLCGRHGVFQNP